MLTIREQYPRPSVWLPPIVEFLIPLSQFGFIDFSSDIIKLIYAQLVYGTHAARFLEEGLIQICFETRIYKSRFAEQSLYISTTHSCAAIAARVGFS